MTPIVWRNKTDLQKSRYHFVNVDVLFRNVYFQFGVTKVTKNKLLRSGDLDTRFS